MIRLAVAAAWPGFGSIGTVRAQNKPLRIGIIAYGRSDMSRHLRQALTDALRERGYREGQELLLVDGYAEARPGGVPQIAKEFAALDLDMVVTTCTPTTQAMRRATQSTTLVMAGASDPVGQGLIASYRQPGANITGVASQFEDIAARMLQLLVETVPGASPVAVAFNPQNPVHQVFLREIDASAQSLKVSAVPVAIGRADDVVARLGGAGPRRFESMMVLPDDPFFSHLRRQFVAVAAQQRMPSLFGIDEAVEEGGLMSYGQPLVDAYARAAYYVDRIAKGTKPDALPVEQPTRFLLVVNNRTAKSLGISIPRSILVRADRIIE